MVTKLSRLGYEVTDVDNGHVPNLLITDSLKPRMNGLQLVRALRQSSNFDLSALPVIILTSRQGEQDIIEGLGAGLDDYIIKPFSHDELAARVRTMLWRANRRSAT